nr:immunoglobulin heavy chain junction region [Homo sapiens]
VSANEQPESRGHGRI